MAGNLAHELVDEIIDGLMEVAFENNEEFHENDFDNADLASAQLEVGMFGENLAVLRNETVGIKKLIECRAPDSEFIRIFDFTGKVAGQDALEQLTDCGLWVYKDFYLPLAVECPIHVDENLGA
jgi:hypothetical protein